MTCTTLKARLDAAKEAYHALLLGASVREVVDSNGERITYTAANRDALRAYIAALESEIANAGTSGVSSRLPMSVFF